jgi:lysophospholipase L1-like esterase
MSGGGGAAGATGGTGNPGECVRGATHGKDVAVIGESFIAASHQITGQIEAQAKAAGSLPQSEKYVDNSVSGTTLANNQIPSQYDKAVQSPGTIKYVLMDGGGNDCLINNNGAAALTAATTLFQTMATKNTEKIVYFFYPDPIGSNFTSLKSCLDTLRPQMKALCDGLTAPKCYWLDLRETWNGHNEYTSDGIHPTTEGSKATGDAIWKVMVDNCVAQ